MKELIIKALNDAYAKCLKASNSESKKHRQFSKVDITTIQLSDLPNFVKDNNIPDNAFFEMSTFVNFDGENEGDGVVLRWEIDGKPWTEKEREAWRAKRFESYVWEYVRDMFKENGYKIGGCDTRIPIINEFTNNARKPYKVYDAYMNKDLEKLADFYMARFHK